MKDRKRKSVKENNKREKRKNNSKEPQRKRLSVKCNNENNRLRNIIIPPFYSNLTLTQEFVHMLINSAFSRIKRKI
jgi:hypothetical protein